MAASLRNGVLRQESWPSFEFAGRVYFLFPAIKFLEICDESLGQACLTKLLAVWLNSEAEPKQNKMRNIARRTQSL